ncbi:hypothetical protein [Parendozoicomonas sp. Alg238-R29]|uniref:hypothetical protein n=1 Tax=Parendozoicomonas sp. Alg238-R29 TaxID=2993446 RepID=UPI00248DE1B5|nr:hypothetical protein [Parendozoicomonas sp. Alg238-R29]
MKTMKNNRPVFFAVLVAFISVLWPTISEAAIPTVITLQWFTDKRAIMLLVKMPSEHAEDVPAHRLLLPVEYKNSVIFEGVMRLGDGYLYKVTPKQSVGTVQLFAAVPLTLTVQASDPPRSDYGTPKSATPDIVAAYTGENTPHGVVFRVFDTKEHHTSLNEEELRTSLTGSVQQLAKDLATLHHSASEKYKNGRTTVQVFYSYTQGTSLLAEETSLSTVFPNLESSSEKFDDAAGAPDPPDTDSLTKQMTALKLEPSVQEQMASLVNKEMLSHVQSDFPNVAKLALAYLPKSEAALTVEPIPFIILAQAFKDQEVKLQDLPVFSGTQARSDIELKALQAVYEHDFSSLAKHSPPPEKAENSPETGITALEQALLSKLNSGENTDAELWDLTSTVWGSDKAYIFNEVCSGANSSKCQIVTPLDSISDPSPPETTSHMELYFPLEEERLTKLENAARIMAQSSTALPVWKYKNHWTGTKLFIRVVSHDTRFKPLTTLLKGQPLLYPKALNYFGQILRALDALYRQQLIPSRIHKDSIVLMENKSSPSVQFSSTLWSPCNSFAEGCSELSGKALQDNIDELLKLYLELRTGLDLKTVSDKMTLINFSDTPSDAQSMEAWRQSPTETWATWMTITISENAPTDEQSFIAGFQTLPKDANIVRNLLNLLPGSHAPNQPKAVATSGGLQSASPATVTQILPTFTRYLSCDKGHALVQSSTRDIGADYAGVCGKAGVYCNAPDCTPHTVTDEFVMHCSECGNGLNGYDKCMASCARALGIPGFPPSVTCTEGHCMKLSPGNIDANPHKLIIHCDGKGCTSQPKQDDIRGEHHYTCAGCYGKEVAEDQLAGFDYCINCAVSQGLMSAQPTGPKSHKHKMKLVTTRSSGRLCSNCGTENPVQQWRFQCQSCPQVNLCTDCAATELEWPGARKLSTTKQ